jgi:hypothetical protein
VNDKAFRFITRKIKEVLKVEPMNLVIKRPIGPMIMVELQDINKLAKSIIIPSLDEHVIGGAMALQKITNSKFPNQCKKCRKFVTSHENVKHRKLQFGVKQTQYLMKQALGRTESLKV